MKLHELRPSEGAFKTSKRLGRGTGSGLGKTIETKAQEKYARNIEGAKKLLAEAGWKDTNSEISCT